jgi:hypothetical protein
MEKYTNLNTKKPYKQLKWEENSSDEDEMKNEFKK